jgi:hypothetical protein
MVEVRRPILLRFFLLVALVGCGLKKPAPSTLAEKYENQIVRRPGDSVEDSKVFVVLNHKRCWVIHSEWLPKHGYKWPDDVKTILASELEQIPVGEPVN